MTEPRKIGLTSYVGHQDGSVHGLTYAADPIWCTGEVVDWDGAQYQIESVVPRIGNLNDVILYPVAAVPAPCTRAPVGWTCTRGAHSEGSPCAALPTVKIAGAPSLGERVAERIHRTYHVTPGPMRDYVDVTALSAAFRAIAEVRVDLAATPTLDRGVGDYARAYHDGARDQRAADLARLT